MSDRYGRESIELLAVGELERFNVPGEPPVRYVSYEKTIEYDPATQADLDKRFLHSIKSVGSLKILVVGAGTLGNEYVKDLVAAGIADITIVDMDAYEYYNLPRSPMVRNADVGQNKAMALARRVAEAAPFSVKVTGIDADVSRLGAGFMEQFDLLMSPVDSWSIRAYVSRMSKLLGIPHITSGTSVLGYGEGAMMATTITIEPRGSSPCYECLVKGTLKDQEAKLSCLSIKPETQAQVIPFSAVSAGFAVQSALAVVTGKFRTGAENGGTPKAWMYQVREMGMTDDSDGNTITSCRSTVNPRCAFHSGLAGVANHEVTEIRISRESSIREIWHMLNGIFGGDGVYEIDLRWSAVYYMVYPEGATSDENRTPPINVVSVDDRDDEELDVFAIHRLPPDHFYMVEDVSRLETVKRVVRIRLE